MHVRRIHCFAQFSKLCIGRCNNYYSNKIIFFFTNFFPSHNCLQHLIISNLLGLISSYAPRIYIPIHWSLIHTNFQKKSFDIQYFCTSAKIHPRILQCTINLPYMHIYLSVFSTYSNIEYLLVLCSTTKYVSIPQCNNIWWWQYISGVLLKAYSFPSEYANEHVVLMHNCGACFPFKPRKQQKRTAAALRMCQSRASIYYQAFKQDFFFHTVLYTKVWLGTGGIS